MGISVVMLAYKEEENLNVLLPRINEQMEAIGEDYEVLVIDAAKPLDNTQAVCEKNGARYINQEEPFFAGAFKTGIKYASKEKFLILDADCSHDPIAIPAINEKFMAENADVVIGSRYTEGGVSNDSATSRAMSALLNGCFRKALDLKARDLSTDYRMYKTADLKRVDLKCERYDVLEEVLLKLRMLNGGKLKVCEVPIEFKKRSFGESKRSLFVFIMHYLRTLLSLGLQWRLFKRNPNDQANNESRAELMTNVILYFLIGCCGAVVDYIFFCIANAIIGQPLVSNVVGAVFGFFFTFYFNTFFNYISRGHYAKKFCSYALVCLVGTFVSTGMMQVCMMYLNVYVLKIFCTIVSAVIQFILNRVITYRIFGNEGPRNMLAR